MEKGCEHKRIFLEFEGIFRDAMLWVNGVYIDRHLSGYTGFLCEITDHLVAGENSIAVRVDSDQPEGWFYEGAGIYRNVHLLNGQPLKFHGACVHQDFGGVGIALPDNLQYYKIQKLKEKGVNAYRCSHHAPAPALLRACDELGMLVLDETRMFGTAPEAVRQLKAMVRPDRNHPCVFAWCIGNEEFSVQDLPWSRKLVEKVTRIVKSLDDTGDVTMPWGRTPKGWVQFFEEREYLAGGFMWTGFDYHGEANPFVNANVSSSFGAIDLCGIEKPPFYYYKAWWGREPWLVRLYGGLARVFVKAGSEEKLKATMLSE